MFLIHYLLMVVIVVYQINFMIQLQATVLIVMQIVLHVPVLTTQIVLYALEQK